MKTVHNFVAYVLTWAHRALDGVCALRADAARARRASAMAQLSRRGRAELRALYLSPGQIPEHAPPATTGRANHSRHRMHWLGQRG